MEISNLTVENLDKELIQLSAEVSSNSLGTKKLWFSTYQKYKNFIDMDSYNGFLVGVLYTAMIYGENIHVYGKVSQKLLFNINNYIIPLLKSYTPSAHFIEVTSDIKTTEIHNNNGVGTGFSGGVDSFCTIFDHYEMEEAKDYKINRLLFLNVGSNGNKDKEKVEYKFLSRFNFLKQFPDEIGLDYIPLDSNLYEFHPWGHQKVHTLTSSAGILIMQKEFNKYYYSSSGLNYGGNLDSAKINRDADLGAYSDPILLPLLSTETLEFIADGNQYTRTEKTIRISQYEPTYRYLNVCANENDSFENCSKCFKCSRTMVTLDFIGELDKYNGIFDINKYNKIKPKKYIATQVAKQNYDVYAKDIVKLARKLNIKLPNRMYSELVTLKNVKPKLKNTARKHLSFDTYSKLKSMFSKN